MVRTCCARSAGRGEVVCSSFDAVATGGSAAGSGSPAVGGVGVA